MRRFSRSGILVVLLLAGCAGLTPGHRDDIELGWLDRSVFDKPSLAEFKAVYDTTQIDPAMVEMIRGVNSDVDVIVFLGTWCPDSKREVPRFLKIADLTGITAERVRLYGLDRSKKSQDGETEKYAITRVPTFVFLKDGVEIGRITEFPQMTLEGDLLSILAASRQR